MQHKCYLTNDHQYYFYVLLLCSYAVVNERVFNVLLLSVFDKLAVSRLCELSKSLHIIGSDFSHL